MRKEAFIFVILGLVIFLGTAAGMFFGFDVPLKDFFQAKVLIIYLCVTACLLILGFFMGHFYSRKNKKTHKAIDSLRRFRRALDFERQQRARLEKQLFEERTSMVGLKNKLKSDLETSGNKDAVDSNKDVADSDLKNIPHLSEIIKNYENIKEELKQRKSQMADLHTELSIAASDVEKAHDEIRVLKESSIPAGPYNAAAPIELRGEALHEILMSICSIEGVLWTLVSDDHSMVMEKAGELVAKDVAALSYIIESAGREISEELEMEPIHSINLTTNSGKVLSANFFDIMDARHCLFIFHEESTPIPLVARQATLAIRAFFE